MGVNASPSGLTEGRIVHWVPALDCGLGPKGRHIPAAVVKVWDREAGCCNLSLFLDGSNDDRHWGTAKAHSGWVTSVSYDETGTTPNTWHYPERAE